MPFNILRAYFGVRREYSPEAVRKVYRNASSASGDFAYLEAVGCVRRHTFRSGGEICYEVLTSHEGNVCLYLRFRQVQMGGGGNNFDNRTGGRKVDRRLSAPRADCKKIIRAGDFCAVGVSYAKASVKGCVCEEEFVVLLFGYNVPGARVERGNPTASTSGVNICAVNCGETASRNKNFQISSGSNLNNNSIATV